ncbi:MAG: Tad domain-containing protein [Pseudomonadota bacterium]
MKLRLRDTLHDIGTIMRATRRFSKEEDGAMTIFACFMIFIMMMVCGIGVDMMRHEMERTRLQAVADRAVLAAADLDQSLDPTAVVLDYFEKAGLADFVTANDVVPDVGDGYKIVTVNSGLTFDTQFMDFLGKETLEVAAVSTAEERVPKVEISLVLDISGSMNFSNRMTALRPAAAAFLNTVLADEVLEKTSVTIVPYAGQVNVGPTMFARSGGQRYPLIALDEELGGVPEGSPEARGLYLPGSADPNDPDFVPGGDGEDDADPTRYVYPNVSSCLEIFPADFSSIGMPSGGSYTQTAHFMNWAIQDGIRADTGQPAMEWGWCPQDDQGIKYFSNERDALVNFVNTMPMHDGTGTHYGMKYGLAMLDPSSQDDVTALIAAGEASGDFAGRPAPYSDGQTQKYIILMTDGGITQQDRPDDTMDDQNVTVELNSRGSERQRLTNAGTNVNSFNQQCNFAKSRTPRPVVVYTIAFETNGSGRNQMRDCASSPSHFFSANDRSIAAVFQAIARRINELRLTQ